MNFPHQNIFPIAYTRHKGGLVTRAQYQKIIAEEYAKELAKVAEANRKRFAGIRERAKTTRLTYQRLAETVERGVADPLYVRFPMAFPIQDCQPTKSELEIGIPVCCKHEPMKVSRFNLGLWRCDDCKRTRLR